MSEENQKELPKKPEKVIVEDQFRDFIARARLKIEDIPRKQLQEMRRCFYGAWGQLLVVLNIQLPKMSDDDGMKYMARMTAEVQAFWDLQVQQDNDTN